ncbi:hypothetical protein [Hyperthermus butylicus]|uniref:Uncharacterized protein n=1 Tax=Hyperthermus butylicus (strain DSM 5456 / JCM 9403 / PLM1-5) TaxID=415426 RepID=A2BJG0_HYPBU|nr:hypothetical protein [Hyperthermus butylicus]ABM80121.1 hypothetical protein Hbut_0249 [Hyperthermus butylicus DSM 5456]
MPLVRREAVLDVHASCDQVLQTLASKNYAEFFEGAGRLLEKGEKRGAIVLSFASPRYKRLRLEVSAEKEPERLQFHLSGDAKGYVAVTVTPRGSACRVYVEAEAEGRLLEEYGGEALTRIVNRIITVLVSVFPAILQPRVPGGRLGDVFVDLLSLLSLAHTGPAGLRARNIRAMTVNVEEKRLIAVDGIAEDTARRAAQLLSEALTALSRALDTLGIQPPQRLALVAGNHIVYANIAGGLSVVTILQKAGKAETGEGG